MKTPDSPSLPSDTPVATWNTTILAVALLLDVVVVFQLAGSLLAGAVFVLFVGAFLLPACLIVMRLPHVRTMPPGLRLTAAGVLVMIAVVPWFFLRKVVPFSPAIADVAICAILLFLAAKYGEAKATREALSPALRTSRPIVLIVLPMIFLLGWLGYAAPAGHDVLFHGLFAVDFGNLVTVVATLRASPLLPLSAVAGGGPINYHWLYFTLPATLVDFCGASIPAFNALILINLLSAALLVHTLSSVVSAIGTLPNRRSVRLTVAAALFAPFSIYYYQLLAARLPLGWLAMPVRNHLILSPVNSMLVFGNNTFALVLVLLAAMTVERWNREGRIADVLLGIMAVSMVIGYSVTLLFPLVAALLLWLALGRIARPITVLLCAILTGGAAVAMFVAIHVLGSGRASGARHLASAFDNGQYLLIVVLGMLPLWGLLFLAGRRALSFFHVLAGTSIVVPSFVYVAGSPTGLIDFSMKTGSLIAIAFAPLIAVTFEKWSSGALRRWQKIGAVSLVILGAIQTSAYILQFPYYRLAGSRSRGLVLSRDYYEALIWLRDHTLRRSIVVDPGGLAMRDELPTLWIAERRVWLPTPNTEAYAVPVRSSAPSRDAVWEAFVRDPANVALAHQIASQADYLVTQRVVQSPYWSAVHRSGTWWIYRSAASATVRDTQ